MTIFKKRKVQPQTRIVHVGKVRDTTQAQAMARSVLYTQRWDIRRGEFRGFDSPPGRF